MTRQAEKPKHGEGAQLALLEELKGAAAQLGFQVREEKLLREVGYHVRSGGCRLRDTNLILLERSAPPHLQIEVLVEVLCGQSLEALYLSPAARELLDQAAQRVTPPTPSADHDEPTGGLPS